MIGTVASRPARGLRYDANRFELKYVVHDRVARTFAERLADYTVPDPHSGPEGYHVDSVYWDSRDLVFFWEKVDGEKFRRKLRFRTYDGAGRVHVEIKQRVDRTVQKRRAVLSVKEAVALFGEGDVDARLAAEVRDRALREALFLCRHHDLAPRMAVSYRRQALLGVHDPDLRVTFDRRLQRDAHVLDLRQRTREGDDVLSPELVVIEIKFCHRVPLWLARLARSSGLELRRFSKYCSAVDAEYFQGRFA